MADVASLPQIDDLGGERLINFLPYQRRWLADRSRFKIGMFSRQSGKTFTTSAELVEDCIDHEIAGKRTRWVILSRGERQAKEAMDANVKPMTRAFWELYRGVLNGPAPEVTEDEFRVRRDDGTDASYRMFEVEYPGGSRISALPANPDTARGFSANVLFDEFAFHQSSKAIWGAAFPIISKGWKCRVVSTPNGKSNKFYDLMTEVPSIWSRHQVDIYQAVAQGLDRNIEELRAGLGDADLWAQEYELQWRDEASAWLGYELIQACETEGYGHIREMDFSTSGELVKLVERGVPPMQTNGRIFVGVDIARKKDLTCIWVDELIGDVLYPREVVTMRRAPFSAQYAEIERIDRRDNFSRLEADETGMGMPFVEELKRRLGESRVGGVIFTPQTKFALATLMKERMEDRRARLPVGEKPIREDLHSITKAVSSTGSVRLLHDGESDGHGDRFWARSLAINASTGNVQEFGYHGQTREQRAEGGRMSDRPRHDDDHSSAGGRFGAGAW